jgi:hypothetical protein
VAGQDDPRADVLDAREGSDRLVRVRGERSDARAAAPVVTAYVQNASPIRSASRPAKCKTALPGV